MPHVSKNGDMDPYKKETFALVTDSFSCPAPSSLCVCHYCGAQSTHITLREEEIVAGVRHKVFPEFIILKYKVLQACCLLCQTALCFLSIWNARSYHATRSYALQKLCLYAAFKYISTWMFLKIKIHYSTLFIYTLHYQYT